MGDHERLGSTSAFDHLIVFVDDPAPLRSRLAAELGLHVHPDSVVFGDGIANLIVPLAPPEYLELIYVQDQAAFEQRQAARPGSGLRPGLVAWALRTRDLGFAEKVLGRPPDAEDRLADGSAPAWRTLSPAGDPFGFPFYIEYRSSPEDRLQLWRRRLDEVHHEAPPSGIVWVEVSTPNPEALQSWLAPAADLDVRTRLGPPELRAAFRVGDRQLTLASDTDSGIVID